MDTGHCSWDLLLALPAPVRSGWWLAKVQEREREKQPLQQA
jgi:hypothetical protein